MTKLLTMIVVIQSRFRDDESFGRWTFQSSVANALQVVMPEGRTPGRHDGRDAEVSRLAPLPLRRHPSRGSCTRDNFLPSLFFCLLVASCCFFSSFFLFSSSSSSSSFYVSFLEFRLSLSRFSRKLRNFWLNRCSKMSNRDVTFHPSHCRSKFSTNAQKFFIVVILRAIFSSTLLFFPQVPFFSH